MFWKKKEKREIKEIGKLVSWDEWDECKLPVATESFIITLVQQGGEVNNIVVRGLADLDVFFHGDEVSVVLHTNLIKGVYPEGTKLKQFQILYTDDPTAEFAGDWTNLGFLRIFFASLNPSVKYTNGAAIITAKKDNFLLGENFNDIFIDKAN